MLIALGQDMPALRLGMASNRIVILLLNSDATKHWNTRPRRTSEPRGPF